MLGFYCTINDIFTFPFQSSMKKEKLLVRHVATDIDIDYKSAKIQKNGMIFI